MSRNSNMLVTLDMEEGEDGEQFSVPHRWSEETTRETHAAAPERSDKSVNEDENIYYDSDVDYRSPSSSSTSSNSSQSSPSSSTTSSQDLPTPLFPTPLPSISSIYPRWTHITTLQTHYIAQYTAAHTHLGILNLQLAAPDSPTATQSFSQRRLSRRLLQSSRKADIKILLRAMLQVARLTGEKIKLQEQATQAYKREHQRQLWRQQEQGQGAAVLYGMMEAWWSRERYKVVTGRGRGGRREVGGWRGGKHGGR